MIYFLCDKWNREENASEKREKEREEKHRRTQNWITHPPQNFH